MLEFFQRGQRMILVKNWKFTLSVILNKIGQEILFVLQQVRKQGFLDNKILINKVATLDFIKGDKPWFLSKLQISSLF